MTYNIPTAKAIFSGNEQTQPQVQVPGSAPEGQVQPKATTDVAQTQQFTKPDNDAAPNVPLTNYTEEAKDQNAKAKEEAESDSKGTYEYARSVDETDINENNNVNYAQQSNFGTFNDMSAEQTMQGARNVDAYNNRPVDKLMIGGSAASGTGSYNLGNEVEKYSRPQVSTVESRLNEQNMQLDVRQRELAQDLQAAVNGKNWDAYSKLISQMYGYDEKLFDNKVAMNVWKGQQLGMQVLNKDAQDFAQRLGLYYNERTARFIYACMDSDPLLASVISNAVTGYGAPSLTQKLSNDMVKKVLSIAKDNNLSESDVMSMIQLVHNTAAGSELNQLWDFTRR